MKIKFFLNPEQQARIDAMMNKRQKADAELLIKHGYQPKNQSASYSLSPEINARIDELMEKRAQQDKELLKQYPATPSKQY